MCDAGRLQQRFAEVIASDHRYGGQLGIEQRAAALAEGALNLQNAGSATQRVRSSLYGCAASFRSSAMRAAIDGRRYSDAKAHVREAQALAEMSGDQAVKFCICRHAGPCTGTSAVRGRPSPRTMSHATCASWTDVKWPSGPPRRR